MRRSHAALGSVLFFVAAPGTVVGLIPWLITRWQAREDWSALLGAAGLLLIAGGLVPLIRAFVEFARAGGTPMPAAPTPRLVVSGFNRYVRNPMYVGVVAVILGQALLFGRLSLMVYAVVVWSTVAAFVRCYEEPTLLRQFGEEYRAYRRAVPAWWPRRRPWTASSNGSGHLS